MDSVCGSIFWNDSIIQDPTPDFTPCFQKSVFKWTPCFLFWILYPFRLIDIRKNTKTKLKKTILTHSKLIIITCLIISQIIKIIYAWLELMNQRNAVHVIDFLSPAILILTYVFVFILTITEIDLGYRTSFLQFIFWGACLTFSTFTLRTKFIQIAHRNFSFIESLDFLLSYSLFLVMFVLSLYSEKRLNLRSSLDPYLKPYPADDATLLSKLCFWWLNPLISIGYKKEIKREDMWEINESEMCKILTEAIEKEWLPLSEQHMKLNRMNLKQYSDETKHQTEQEIFNKTKGDKSYNKEPSLIWCIIKVSYKKFLTGSVLKLVYDLIQFSGPIILNRLILFISDKNQASIIGYFFTLLLLFFSVIQTISLQHYFYTMFIIGARIRTCLMGLIYKKSIRLSANSRNEATTGELINLMQINTQTIVDLVPFLNMLWSAPLQIVICSYLLWGYLQISLLTCIGVIVLFIPINSILTGWMTSISKKKLKSQDARIKQINELLNGMKVIKMLGWENLFKTMVEKVRSLEINQQSNKYAFYILLTLGSNFMSFYAGGFTFFVYILTGANRILDPSTTFVSLTLFNLINFPLLLIPQVFTGLIQTKIAFQRIQSFLLREEINEEQIEHFEHQENAIMFENADLGWSHNESEKNLKGIQLNVRHGELVAVVGRVGSGKSSLLISLFGEMTMFKGKINTHNNIAYASQQAWLQNSSLQNNILFGSKYDKAFYDQVITACALEPDINMLPCRDLTEIGEKGINLSGGQKQRISLARSVYSNSDIYVFDDPLSAVDSHVAKQLFENVIGPNGILKNKTRLFATNSLNFLPQCDKIVMLAEGEIQLNGIYSDLIKEELFSNFFGEFLKSSKEKLIDASKEIDEPVDLMISNRKNSILNKIAGAANIIHAEKVEKGKIKLAIIFEYFKSCSISSTTLSVLFLALACITQATNGFWLSSVSEKSVTESKQNKTTDLGDVGIYLSIGFLQTTLLLLSDIFFFKMVINSSKCLHKSMFNSILRCTMSFFESTPVGRLMNRFSKDIEAVEDQIPMSFKVLARNSFTLLTTLAIISISSPYFLIPLLPIAVVYVFYQRYYVTSIRQLRRLNSVNKSPIFSFFGETLNGITTIRSYSAQNRFVNTMENKIDNSLLFYYPDTVSTRWLGMRLEFIGGLITFFACLFAIIGKDSSNGSQAGLSISYALSITQVLNLLVRASADFESNITSVERINEYCQEDNHEDEWIKQHNKPSLDWPKNGRIEFVNYSVTYRDDLNYCLRNINCTIMPFDKIGIVGRTGAGKSSLVLALLRIIETGHGKILIDGVDIKSIGLHDLRSKITIVPQDPVLFSGSLRMNIDPFDAYSDKEIWESLENVRLKEHVKKLDNQLLFECNEEGNNFSVGQKQLICLARALLRKTKVLILDEATAAIDHTTDDAIQSAIRTIFIDCTVITIAHRLNTIIDSTKIMVLEKGEMVEFDSPDILLSNKDSIFYSMAESANLV